MLAVYKSDDTNFMLMQTKWSSQLNPVLNSPITAPTILKGVTLQTGVNTINTGLTATLQGWFIVDQDAAATIYRSSPKAPLTLTLTVSGPVTVDIAVF